MRFLKPVLLATMLAMPVAAFADDAGRITVTGDGSVQVVPDIASISLGVTTQGKTAAEALTANSTALATVMERLKAAGIDARDIQTSNLAVSPNWSNYDSETPQTITGYTAANMVTVTLRDLAKLGALLDSAVSDGANTLNGLSFGLADPKPAKDEARRRAVADALDRARLLSGASGVGLGKVVSIAEDGGYSQPMPVFAAKAEAARDVPVAAGSLDVAASVTIILELTQ